MASELAGQVSAFLVRHCGLPFCADCLAHELALHRELVATAIAALEPATHFERDRRLCARCMRTAPTTRAVPRVASA